MLKLQRSADETKVVFTLSGRIKAADLADLQKFLNSERGHRSLVLDLKEIKLVDRDAVNFLADCEAKRIKLANCPAYIREWIKKEAAQSEES